MVYEAGVVDERVLAELNVLHTRRHQPGTLLAVCYSIGVMSVPVIVITGFFIGMVLAVQSYGQYHNLGLDTWIGSMIHQSVIKIGRASCRERV